MVAKYPILTIWKNPRRTMQHLIQQGPVWPAFLFASASGVVNALGIVQRNGLAQDMNVPLLLGLTIGIGVIAGIAFLIILSWLFKVIGKWLKAEGSYKELQTAVGWATLPFLGSLIIWIIEISLYGKDYFMGEQAAVSATAPYQGLELVFTLLILLFSVYAIVFLLAGVAEAHRVPLSHAFAIVFILFLLYLILSIAVQALTIGM